MGDTPVMDGTVDIGDLNAVLNNFGASANVAPVANAGADSAITLPAVASLDGTVTDDGYR